MEVCVRARSSPAGPGPGKIPSVSISPRLRTLALLGGGALVCVGALASGVLATRRPHAPARRCTLVFDATTPEISDGELRAVPEPDVALRWAAFGETEARVIGSRALALRAADRLLRGARLGTRAGLSRDALAGWLREAQAVVPAERARVLEVAVQDADPEVAADAANALCEVYVEERLGRRQAAVDSAVQALRAQAGEVRGELAGAEQHLDRFRKEVGLVVPLDEQVSIRQHEVTRLHEALTAAKIKRIELEARGEGGEDLEEARRVEKAFRKELDLQTRALHDLQGREADWRRLSRDRDLARERLDRLVTELGRLDPERRPVISNVRILDRAVP